MRANRILAMHHVKAENIFMLEGSVAYRTGHCLSVVHGGIVVRWIDQGFNPEIWDEHTNIRPWLHGGGVPVWSTWPVGSAVGE